MKCKHERWLSTHSGIFTLDDGETFRFLMRFICGDCYAEKYVEFAAEDVDES